MSIRFENVNFNYTSQVDTVIDVLKDINVTFEDNCFVSIVGHTGSGKSTLVQNINALLQPKTGVVYVDEYAISNEKIKNLKGLRNKIGMSFQFSESQLFEETVLKDVMFGPINFGYSKEEAEEVARMSLIKVGISEDLFERSPFELSGGQMRRVALAGILAYDPSILILDEPTAGLDPIGQHQMMELFKKLHSEGKTIIMISHNFNHVLEYSEKILLLEEGNVIFDGKVTDFFESDISTNMNIQLPNAIDFRRKLTSEKNVSCNYAQLVDWIVDNYGK